MILSEMLARFERYPYILDIPRQIADGSLLDQDKLVILAFDALGRNRLNLSFLEKRVYRTVFPSSTPVFFYSFHSLLEPGEHGFVGFRFWWKKLGKIVVIPPWFTVDGEDLNEKVSKREVFPWEPIFTKLKKRGYSSTYFIEWPDQAFARSVGKEATRVKHKWLADLSRVPECDSDIVYVYNYLMDSLKHKYLGGSEIELGGKLIEQTVKYIWKKLEPGTRLIVLSDHGQARISRRVIVPDIGEIPPTGGGNTAFLKNPDMDKLESWIKKNKVDVTIHEISELKDIYGKLSRKVKDRYGDILLVSHGGDSFAFPYEKKKKVKVGAHGGVTPEEMLVNVWIGVKK